MGGVSASLARPAAGPEMPSPPAVRARRPSWRDPRLAVGLALVCVSVLVGARVLGSADDTVRVLAAGGDLAAGQRVSRADLTEVRLRFAAEEDADRYLGAAQELPKGAVLTRAVGAGELLPRAAVSTDREPLVELPLAVDPARVPASLRAGSLVDVWVTGGDTGRDREAGPTDLLLAEVPVLSVSRAGGLGPGGMRQVVVGIPGASESSMEEVVRRLQGSLLVLRRPG